ncbi:MAG TPA: YwqG family protein [Candidatus Limnocylindrales bacterium]|nr:YwqG family protein [Candidatus Limnocylindrales bacterium]
MREFETRFAKEPSASLAHQALDGLRDPSLGRVWDRIVNLARPSARLVRSSGLSGVTRLGGSPLVGPDFRWPLDPSGEPLAFVGQVDLAEIRKVSELGALPATGVLGFFYAARDQPSGYQSSDRQRWAISYSREPISVVSSPPGTLGFPEVALNPTGDLTLPQGDSVDVENLELNPIEADAYESVLDELRATHGAGRQLSIHRVGGWPDAIQRDPPIAAQLASNGVDAGDLAVYQLESTEAVLRRRATWRLVAQFDSDESIGMMWGVYGRLYFSMREQDLEQRTWETAWAVMQWS